MLRFLSIFDTLAAINNLEAPTIPTQIELSSKKNIMILIKIFLNAYFIYIIKFVELHKM